MYFQIFGLAIWKQHFSINILTVGYKGILVIEVDSDYDDDCNYVGKTVYVDILYFRLFQRIYYNLKRMFMARSWLKKHKDDIKKDLEELR